MKISCSIVFTFCCFCYCYLLPINSSQHDDRDSRPQRRSSYGGSSRRAPSPDMWSHDLYEGNNDDAATKREENVGAKTVEL